MKSGLSKSSQSGGAAVLLLIFALLFTIIDIPLVTAGGGESDTASSVLLGLGKTGGSSAGTNGKDALKANSDPRALQANEKVAELFRMFTQSMIQSNNSSTSASADQIKLAISKLMLANNKTFSPSP